MHLIIKVNNIILFLILSVNLELVNNLLLAARKVVPNDLTKIDFTFISVYKFWFKTAFTNMQSFAL